MGIVILVLQRTFLMHLVVMIIYEGGGQCKHGKTESSVFFWTATVGGMEVSILEEEGQS